MAIGDELEIKCSLGELSGETTVMLLLAAHLFALLNVSGVGVFLGDLLLLVFCLKREKIMSIKVCLFFTAKLYS